MLSSAELALQYAHALASSLCSQQAALSPRSLKAAFCSVECAKMSHPALERDFSIQISTEWVSRSAKRRILALIFLFFFFK